LTEYLIDLKKFQNENKLSKALHYFNYLPLFEEELILLSEVIDERIEQYKQIEELDELSVKIEKVPEDGDIKESLSRKEFGEKAKQQIEFDQILGKLRAKSADAMRDKEEHMKKRKAMKKRLYSEILIILESKRFLQAAERYLELAFDFSKRKDLGNSSLMITLYGLSLLKTDTSIQSIKETITKYLNSLGINKKLVEETFPIMLILFIIDTKIKNFIDYQPQLKETLEILPLFEEEKILIVIED
jgi:hypothetical protein